MKKKTQEGNFVTIDIGSVSVKAVVVEITGKVKRLVSVEEEKYESPLQSKEDEQSRNIIVNALRCLNKRLLSGKNVTVGALYHNRELQVKIIDLPQQIQIDALEKTLNWEARKMLSPSYKDAPYSYSYKVIRSNPFSVVISVIPDSLLKKHVDLFKAAGIKLSGVYPEVYSGISLLNMADISGLPAVSIINMGYMGTHLQIFSAGELRFYRYIPSGTSEMSQEPTSAELEVYSQKIRFSFDYFRAVSKLNQIDLLSFMGGGGASGGFLAYEQNYFAPTKITALDVSSGIDIASVLAKNSDENMSAELKQNYILPFIPAVGASLAAFSTDSDKMNLMARMTARDKEKLYENLAGRMHVYAIPIVIVLSLVFFSIYYVFMSEEISNLQAVIEAEKEVAGKFKKIESEEAKESVKGIKTLEDKDGKTWRLLAFSGNLGDLLNPIIERPEFHRSFANIRILANNSGITFEEFLVKTEDEAELINLPSLEANSTNNSAIKEETDKNPYLSSLAQFDIDEQEIATSIDGKICIIKGYGSNISIVAEFVKKLVDAGVDENNNRINGPLLRITSVESRSRAGRTEFLLKGVLP